MKTEPYVFFAIQQGLSITSYVCAWQSEQHTLLFWTDWIHKEKKQTSNFKLIVHKTATHTVQAFPFCLISLTM